LRQHVGRGGVLLDGTSITTVRKSTRTICCTNGTKKIKPGPRTREKRPSVNMTPRSYWRRTLADALARIKTNTSSANGPNRPPRMNIDDLWLKYSPIRPLSPAGRSKTAKERGRKSPTS
jgi:hypothetical protein